MNLGIDPVTAAGLTYSAGKWVYDYQTGLVRRAKVQHELEQTENVIADIKREQDFLSSLKANQKDTGGKILVISGVTAAALLTIFLITK